MENAKKFFEDNLLRINRETDPITWNMNSGLLLMAEQLTEIQTAVGFNKDVLNHLENEIKSNT